jgi:predicted DNA-binding protein
MTITVDLPPDLEERLRERAAKLGQEPTAYVTALVNRDLSSSEVEPKTLADLFAGRIGRINSGGTERLSEDCGEKFAAYLEQKRREGHL